jgi:hypothetical protein
VAPLSLELQQLLALTAVAVAPSRRARPTQAACTIKAPRARRKSLTASEAQRIKALELKQQSLLALTAVAVAPSRFERPARAACRVYDRRTSRAKGEAKRSMALPLELQLLLALTAVAVAPSRRARPDASRVYDRSASSAMKVTSSERCAAR